MARGNVLVLKYYQVGLGQINKSLLKSLTITELGLHASNRLDNSVPKKWERDAPAHRVAVRVGPHQTREQDIFL